MHYHIVFPVKYRKVLLDEEVVRIIRETAVGIQERYEVEIEAVGMDGVYTCCVADIRNCRQGG